MSDDFKQYADGVQTDHYTHRFVHIAVALWAGWSWGWLWGIALFIGLFLAIAVSNTALLASAASLRAIRINRWAWLALALAVVIASTVRLQLP